MVFSNETRNTPRTIEHHTTEHYQNQKTTTSITDRNDLDSRTRSISLFGSIEQNQKKLPKDLSRMFFTSFKISIRCLHSSLTFRLHLLSPPIFYGGGRQISLSRQKILPFCYYFTSYRTLLIFYFFQCLVRRVCSFCNCFWS